MSTTFDQIAANATPIRELGEQLGDMLDNYGVHYLGDALPLIKQLRKLLVETTVLIEQAEDDRGRRVDTSDTQPCLLCNDHYPLAGPLVRGIRYEPVPGKGWAYICWECVAGLEKVLHRQFSGLAYTFLFSLTPTTQKLREQNVPPITDLKEDYSS